MRMLLRRLWMVIAYLPAIALVTYVYIKCKIEDKKIKEYEESDEYNES